MTTKATTSRLRLPGALLALIPLALILLGGCDEGDATAPELDSPGAVLAGPLEVELPLGREVRPGGGVLRLTFLRVVEDSRCPVDVVCVWEGNAVVEVGVAVGSGPSVPVQFNSSLEPRSAEAGGVRLRFLELRPLPRTDAPPPEGYTLRLRVEPL